jgi:hypothetical protein
MIVAFAAAASSSSSRNLVVVGLLLLMMLLLLLYKIESKFVRKAASIGDRGGKKKKPYVQVKLNHLIRASKRALKKSSSDELQVYTKHSTEQTYSARSDRNI